MGGTHGEYMREPVEVVDWMIAVSRQKAIAERRARLADEFRGTR